MSRTASAMAETICPPHIEGRHPMLYFNIQSTEKYSIAMCYIVVTCVIPAYCSSALFVDAIIIMLDNKYLSAIDLLKLHI